MTRKARFAVIGNPIAHSLSPLIHQLFAQQSEISLDYQKIAIDDFHFVQQVRHFFIQGGKGLNITTPYKEQAFALCQQATPRCRKAKAANTLWIEEGQLYGDNTDGLGLIRDLNRLFNLNDKSVVLLGAGGATRGILGPLLAAKPAQLIIANRTAEKARYLQTEFMGVTCCEIDALGDRYDLIINATSANLNQQSIGLSPHILAAQPLCYDLSYHPPITPFMRWAQNHGAKASNGLGMLVEQAAEAFFVWHGIRPEVVPVLAFLQKKWCGTWGTM